MFNGQNIKRLSEIKGVKIKTVCERTGISQVSFYTILSERVNPTADNLEAIADFFDCSFDDFFDRKSYGKEQSCTVSGNGNKVQNGKHNVMMEDQAKEIEYLLKLLKEKEALLEAKNELLREKDRIIRLLENK